MRRIRLQNAKGKWLDLTADPSKYFLHDLSGFGFDTDSEYQQVGYQNLLVSRNYTQMMPSGILSIGNYKLFSDFAKFVQAVPLVLEYTSHDKYVVSCYVQSLTKQEIVEGGKLECPIVFECIGRIAKPISIRADYEGAAGKGYPYTYPFTYESGAAGKFEIESDSMLESPVKLTFIGPVKNPSWTHYRNGEVCCTGKIFCNIPEGHRLVVSNLGEYSITETDALGNFVADLYQFSDFNTQRFIEIGYDTNSLYFTHELSNNVNIILEGQIFYETI